MFVEFGGQYGGWHWKPFSSIRRLALPAVDLVLMVTAVILAYEIRFDGRIEAEYAAMLPRVIVAWVMIRGFWLIVYRFYNQTWEYASIPEMMVIFAAVTAGSVTLYGINLILPAVGVATRVPRSIFAIEWFLASFLLGGSRFYIRAKNDAAAQPLGSRRAKRLLIVGAGNAGAIALREMRRSTSCQVVGFIDDDPKKQGHLVGGVPVLGTRESIPQVVESKDVDEILVAMPSASRYTMRQIFASAQKTGRPVRTLPAIHELINGQVTVNQIREVQIEDLLGRDPVETDVQSIAAYLCGRNVLVTGAGGSIGSELCRQIVRYHPRQLILLGHGENSIFEIERELRSSRPSLCIEPVIADIRDRRKIQRLFETFRPQVVFHAAAHKHVPLMESNPDEAVTNNVLGTRNLVDAASRVGAERFVMISTDKAVHPINAMGCSKRVAEMIVQCASRHSPTRFAVVRFGNVLGSRGSVVPLFKKQIAIGGPVTVTHPEMRRYFMTIPEAAQLVIQAAALGTGGEIFLLSMGEPVRIVDLARDMIRLSGFEPEVDIPITFTGPRPGEKLNEELAADCEKVLPTRHPKIVTLCSASFDESRLDAGLRALEDALKEGNLGSLKMILKTLAALGQASDGLDGFSLHDECGAGHAEAAASTEPLH